MKSLRSLARAAAVGLAATLALGGCAALSEEGSAGGDDKPSGATTVKVGYLHTVAVDDKLWLGQLEGTFEKAGLDLELTEFATGIEASQALSGGSIDVAILGGVTSNFPAQGEGKIFLVNSVEHDTAQLWVSPTSGISSVADLKGKTILTTEGTTADIYLHYALEKAGLTRKDVKVVNAKMPDAVQAFVGGSADAIALWVPFDLRVKEALPGATKIDSAGSYPEARVADGWIANNEWYAENRDVAKKIVEAWLETNEAFRADPEGSLAKVHAEAYDGTAKLADLQHQVGFQTDFTNEQWLEHYENGDVLAWVGQAERAFVALGGVPTYVDPKEFFDTSLFIEVAGEKR